MSITHFYKRNLSSRPMGCIEKKLYMAQSNMRNTPRIPFVCLCSRRHSICSNFLTCKSKLTHAHRRLHIHLASLPIHSKCNIHSYRWSQRVLFDSSFISLLFLLLFLFFGQLLLYSFVCFFVLFFAHFF